MHHLQFDPLRGGCYRFAYCRRGSAVSAPPPTPNLPVCMHVFISSTNTDTLHFIKCLPQLTAWRGRRTREGQVLFIAPRKAHRWYTHTHTHTHTRRLCEFHSVIDRQCFRSVWVYIWVLTNMHHQGSPSTLELSPYLFQLFWVTHWLNFWWAFEA